jgi:hypothetical protein
MVTVTNGAWLLLRLPLFLACRRGIIALGNRVTVIGGEEGMNVLSI